MASGSRWRSLAALAVAAALFGGGVLWVIRETVWSVYRVPTASMAPTLLPGDVVLVDRTAYGWRLPGFGWVLGGATPRPGDVVVLRAPHAPEVLWVKRVVAVEHQQVAFSAGFPVVDGVAPEVELLGADAQVIDCRRLRAWRWREAWPDHEADILLDDDLGSLLRDRPPVVVPEGHVLVVGDNRDHSVDGRQLGPSRVEAVLGRVSAVVVSFDPCTGRRRPGRAGLPVAS